MDNDKKLFEELLKADGIDPIGPTETECDAFAKLLDQLSKSKHSKPGPDRSDIWRIIMKNKITKFATAAVIIVAVLIGINQFDGSIDGSHTAFAAVLEEINNARNVVYKEISEIPNYTFERVEMVNAQGVIRSELDHGTVMIFDFNNSITLNLEPSSKQATRNYRTGRKRTSRGFSYIGWIRKLHETDAEFMGTEELNGKQVNVYLWEVSFEKITVWVDPQSNLPVKVKHERFANKEKNIVMPQMFLSMGDFGGNRNISKGGSISSGRGSGKGISEDTTLTMLDFQWDTDLDESLFSLEPPEGYSLKERQFDDSPIEDDSLIHILGFWAEMRNGQFPSEQELNDPESFKPLLIEKFDKDGDPEQEFELATNELSKVLRGLYVVQEKKVDGSWGYVGQDVLLGEADRIVCWWFDEETEGYKAIFGDLSIGDVKEEQLPEEDKDQ